MSEEKILDRIKKLLALSGSPNENEAQAALLKAQELMVKYNIEKNELEDPEIAKNKKVVEEILRKSSRRVPWYEGVLARVIGENFKTVVFFRPYWNHEKQCKYKVLISMGLEEDVLITKELYSFTLNQIKRLVKKYTEGMNTKERAGFKNTFIHGFISGLEKGFKEQIEQNNWGLVLVKDALVVEEEKKLGLVKAKPNTGIQPRLDGKIDTYNKGYNEGHKIGSNYNNRRENVLEG